MKIISLNTFGGYVFEPLMKFIEKQGVDTDVFCFQEMFSSDDPNAGVAKSTVSSKCRWRLNLVQEIQKILPGHDFYFAATQDDYETEPDYPGQSQLGNAIFYRKSLHVMEKGDFFISNSFNSYELGDWSSLGHNLVYIKIEIDDKPLVICSVHGNSQPPDKLDSPGRLEQSQKILDFLKKQDAKKIVMGDFNLFPNTKSIKMVEEAGFRNLITEFDIKTTRGSMMRKIFPEYEHGKYGWQEYADFTFVTPDLEVKSFEVPDEPISDHLPMILKIG